MRKTKIICTMGPATDKPGIMRKLIESGMDVARFNFSHGSHGEHLTRMAGLRSACDELGKSVAVLLDTKGPEIRIKSFKNGRIELSAGDVFTLTTENIEGDETRVSVTYENLHKDAEAGTVILIDDGLIELTVDRVEGRNIICIVKNGGAVSDNKSINIPNLSINLPYISQKDESDIKFAVENDVDFIAASFVRTPRDVTEVRELLAKYGGADIHIISKIENIEGIKNAEQIIEQSDGIMIARGDLGVEIPFEELPAIQKKLIKMCYRAGKKVITATQMLDSMIRNPRPTRAETSDVANAVYDGTSAIMLSGETAVGKYPVQSLETMSKIVLKTEANIHYNERFIKMPIDLDAQVANVTNAICHATCTTAMDLCVAAIITVSHSGNTAQMLSRFRPLSPIIATTPFKKVCRQLMLSWGIHPVVSMNKTNTDELFEHAVEKALSTGIVKKGDLVVITGGVPVGVSGSTNILKVHRAGDVI